ncbi:unnamed protein product [Heligmosomoides polygyrus]|uniref:Protein amnionless n=1 Tax=Heligmosomoides polygyrus TaxID=6339 RepID=A0A183GPG7_HELPZ|nr:unnamed protein product [Heligmosomoides polygyrus]
MPHRRSGVTCFLILAITLHVSKAKMFVFGGSTRISLLSNWLNNDYPCQGDTIIFEENKKTVTFIDESIQAFSFKPPPFFLDSGVREKVSANFSDPSSWSLDDTPLLHMNMVPGAKDDVVFHDMGAFQVSIDDQVTVNTMKVSRDWVSTPEAVHRFISFFFPRK